MDPETWVDQHGDSLFRYAVMRVGNRSLAEDLVQEALLAALQAQDRFDGRASVRTWLIAILRKKVIDYLRRAKRESGSGDTQFFDPAEHRKRRLRPWSDDPARLLEEKEFWQVFHRCADQLPEKLSDVYYLREIAGLATDEICDLLDIEAANLALRLYRARAAMRHCLDRNWFQHEKK